MNTQHQSAKMPPSQSDTVQSDGVQQRPGFNIDAPMTPRQQAIYERNSTSSPLLRLPIELRLEIWKIAMGKKTIHVVTRDLTSSRGHLICKSPVSESHAYQLSRCPAYEKSMDRSSEEDMRDWLNRHRDCFEPLDGTQEHLDCRIPALCRLTYIEIMETIWGTNTWSFSYSQIFQSWLRMRTTAQLSYISRIHLQETCFDDSVFSLLAERKREPLELLQIYLCPSAHRLFEFGVLRDHVDDIRECPPARKIEVIFYCPINAFAHSSRQNLLRKSLWGDDLEIEFAEEVRVSLMEKMRKC